MAKRQTANKSNAKAHETRNLAHASRVGADGASASGDGQVPGAGDAGQQSTRPGKRVKEGAIGGNPKKRGSPDRARGGRTQAISTHTYIPASQDTPPIPHITSPATPPDLPNTPAPISDEKVKLTDLRRRSLRYVGRDAEGKVIPYHYSKQDADKVAALTAAGYDIEDIAFALNVRPGHLRAHYPKELAGAMIADGKVIIAAHRMAMSEEEPTMTKYWLNNRRGWSSGDGGKKQGDEAVLNVHIHI